MILNSEASRSLMGWKSVNNRILTARFKGCLRKTTIVQVYAPVEEAEKEEKNDFYNSLQDAFNEIPKHCIKILMIGLFGSASHTNNNGERLILFCSINGLCIGNSHFRHKIDTQVHLEIS